MRYSLLMTSASILSAFTYMNVSATCCNENTDTDLDGYCTPDDCNDSDPFTYPGATELCDGLDNSCDGIVPPEELDSDSDGVRVCGDDCDDTNENVKPGQAEVCDGVDSNCDGTLMAAGESDSDGDGQRSCGGDCNDTDASIFSGAAELCDGIDNDCDGSISGETDSDQDSFRGCQGDCNDADASINPTAQEICDNVDEDCDGLADVTTNGDGGWIRSVCAPLMGTQGGYDQIGPNQATVWYNSTVSKYQMWFRAIDANKIARIGYATSPDGLHWTKNPSAVLSSGTVTTDQDYKSVGHPTVILKDGVYYMYYQGQDNANVIRIFRARSTDGITWTKETGAVLDVTAGGLDAKGVNSPSAIFDVSDNKWKLWYSGNDGTYLRTFYAESTDGRAFTKAGTYAINVGGSGEWDSKRVVFARVHKIGSVYHALYTGDDISSSYTYEVGHAWSQDGKTFFKNELNPVLSFSDPGTWDSFMVNSSDFAQTGDGYSMYYTGAPSLDGPYAIGIARSADPFTTVVAPRLGQTFRVGEPVEFQLEFKDYGLDTPVIAYFFSANEGLLGASSATMGEPLYFQTRELNRGLNEVEVFVMNKAGMMSHQNLEVYVE